jgi:hypothetical protein
MGISIRTVTYVIIIAMTVTIAPRSILPRENRDDTPETPIKTPINIACSTLNTGLLYNQPGAPRKTTKS